MENNFSKQKLAIRVGIFDPDLKPQGHPVKFNLDVVDLLSKIFDEVVCFLVNESLQDAFESGIECLGDNVRLAVAPPDLSALSRQAFPERFTRPELVQLPEPAEKERLLAELYGGLWEFVDSHEVDSLIFTSQSETIHLHWNVPDIPYSLFVHVLWKLQIDLSAAHTKETVARTLQGADHIFLLDDYLVEQLRDKFPAACRYPYRRYAPDPQQRRQKEIFFRNQFMPHLATVGVINERRNLDFLIRSIARYQGDIIQYGLYGKPLGITGERIAEQALKTEFCERVVFDHQFEYLSEDEYKKRLAQAHFAIVAYDAERAGQLPSVVYECAEVYTPLIAPAVEPFLGLEQRYGPMFTLYRPLETESLLDCIGEMAASFRSGDLRTGAILDAIDAFRNEHEYNAEMNRLYEIFERDVTARVSPAHDEAIEGQPKIGDEKREIESASILEREDLGDHGADIMEILPADASAIEDASLSAIAFFQHTKTQLDDLVHGLSPEGCPAKVSDVPGDLLLRIAAMADNLERFEEDLREESHSEIQTHHPQLQSLS